jgi:type II restriction enzyme
MLRCDVSVGYPYTSPSQRARVISELWFRSFAFCLSCTANCLVPTTANTRASDFLCPDCNRTYELKAFKVRPKRNLVDGAFNTLMSLILAGNAPTLMLLERTGNWDVLNLIAIHSTFLTPSVVVARKPLSPLARRAGWVGCNIRLDLIASDAKIAVVQDGKLSDRNEIRSAFRRFEPLEEIRPLARGWTTLTFQTIRSLGRRSFSLDDLYAKEKSFSAIYPNNRNTRAKIRQQLQLLRDLGYLEFCGQGNYELLS